MSTYYIIRHTIVRSPIDVVSGRFATEVLATDRPLRLWAFGFIQRIRNPRSLKILEYRNPRRRNYYSIRYRNKLFPTDVLSGDPHPTQVGVSRPCWFRATSSDVAEVGDLRPIASDVEKAVAFSPTGVLSATSPDVEFGRFATEVLAGDLFRGRGVGRWDLFSNNWEVAGA